MCNTVFCVRSTNVYLVLVIIFLKQWRSKLFYVCQIGSKNSTSVRNYQYNLNIYKPIISTGKLKKIIDSDAFVLDTLCFD